MYKLNSFLPYSSEFGFSLDAARFKSAMPLPPPIGHSSRPASAMPALQEYYHMIMSAAWMVILSIIPQDLIRTAAVLLGGLIFVYNIIQAARPQTLIKKLQFRVLSLEAQLQDTIDSGIMAQADPVFTAKIERSMGR